MIGFRSTAAHPSGHQGDSTRLRTGNDQHGILLAYGLARAISPSGSDRADDSGLETAFGRCGYMRPQKTLCCSDAGERGWASCDPTVGERVSAEEGV